MAPLSGRIYHSFAAQGTRCSQALSCELPTVLYEMKIKQATSKVQAVGSFDELRIHPELQLA